MGQAKQRGDFTRRQHEAFDMIEAGKGVEQARAANLQALDESEKQSEAYMKVVISQIITKHWRNSRLGERIPAAAFEAIDPKLLVVSQSRVQINEVSAR